MLRRFSGLIAPMSHSRAMMVLADIERIEDHEQVGCSAFACCCFRVAMFRRKRLARQYQLKK